MERHICVFVPECDLEIRVKQLEIRFDTNKNLLGRYELNNSRFLLTLEEINTKTGKEVQKYKYYDSVRKQFVGSIREGKWLAYCHTSEFYKQVRDLIDELMPEIHSIISDWINGYCSNPRMKIIYETIGGYDGKLCFDLSK